jgi:soluble lytic murein transglycosylase
MTNMSKNPTQPRQAASGNLMFFQLLSRSPTYILLLLGLCFSITLFATPEPTYLTKFLRYLEWTQHLPTTPDPDFLSFIEKPTPLTKKLREKWLYQLAYNKDWATFSQYYRDSSDTNLQCYAQTARLNQGKTQEVLSAAKSLWLSASSLPKACDALFATLLKNGDLSEELIERRVALALENNNLSLARYLLKQCKPARIQDAEMLSDIYQKPTRITQLQPSRLQGEFYLYGLKRIAARNLDTAIELANTPHGKKMMNDAQKQSFYAYIALYKAMRNLPDAPIWFAKVKPTFQNDVLLDWEIRYALNHRNWPEVIRVIHQANDKNNPGNLYWLARAKAELGEKDTANKLYHDLALKRNYYGFLASLQLKQKPHFENEASLPNPKILSAYKPITDQIQDLYLSHQTVQASRLLNDFVSELPKDEKSALAFWIADHLHWHGKSIYLSNNDELNNQLSLRFPLAHRKTIKEYAENYHIPQEFIYAIIRQESSFQEDVISSAGANGLMQVMPATAHLVAKREKIAFTDKNQLLTSQKNIHIGTAYLQQLAKQFHQHPVLMAAAYNAGPRQANYWLKNHEPKDIDIWIETLPWRETRNYLKNIIAFYAVYQYRMQEKLSLRHLMKPF